MSLCIVHKAIKFSYCVRSLQRHCLITINISSRALFAQHWANIADGKLHEKLQASELSCLGPTSAAYTDDFRGKANFS